MSETDRYRHRTSLQVRFYADDWDEAHDLASDIAEIVDTATVGTATIVEGVWLASLETYGPTYNQPWADEPSDREPPWGADTRRFRVGLRLILEADGFEAVWEFTETSTDWLEAFDAVENAHFGMLENLGTAARSPDARGGGDA